jgi:hypothetical protein
MAEVTRYLFTHKEVVEALVKEQDIHEGLWGLVVEFGLAAVNTGASDDELFPTAIIPLNKIGISKVDKLTNLSVDAAVVNPSSAD